MSLTVTDIRPRIGAEINADKDTLLSGKYAKEIRELLQTRGVFVIREIDFIDEEQLAFTRTLAR